eukprot:CAMPEP_0194161766 /NCGR_PEP_ID=MMETSP0152-20130528/79121_1 /TAXON_ID=1049557 /ORGANISM="Thalassiothrix antarctica, Strain L6-D1" /LENGTH=245 /DNA_ID=CAMNT_0038871581 /DNA_START=55 /DNA_END=792 /DNA_ORIENTATION=+
MTANIINNKNNESVDDLSSYERKRLERVQLNQQRLKKLGIVKVKRTIIPRKRKSSSSSPKKPTRYSKRVRCKFEEEEKEIVAKEEEEKEIAAKEEEHIKDDDKGEKLSSSNVGDDGFIVVDYTRLWPKTPEELDDDEFEILKFLRLWRLIGKNEIIVEPFKICDNRTLCELIRRKRNNSNWASSTSDNAVADITQCYGIGLHRAKELGPEMIQIIENDVNQPLFTSSRKRSVTTENDGMKKIETQ